MATNTYDPKGNDELTPDEAKLSSANNGADQATDLIRQKLAHIYTDEPSATAELAESKALSERSKHQQFMYDLGTSGKDLATVQTEWHKYYESLPDDQKHVVWKEFYASQAVVTHETRKQTATETPAQSLAKNKNRVASSGRTRKSPIKKPKILDARSTAEVQSAIRDTVTGGGKVTAKHHLQSLLFGLAMGSIVLIIFLFGFFNEVVVAPFVQPSRASASTPLIVSSNDIAPTAQPEVIIPKINVEIPVDYSLTTTHEPTIETALENGVIHYPSTVKPGEQGNAAFFGHSSNNIFNKGKYKFAFVLLHTLVEGDTFYLTYNGKVYVYKVISRKVVEPTDISVLGPVPGQTATATLITCDPPGTSLRRLVVVGKQISPDPSGNTQAAVPDNTNNYASSPAALPGNGPTLWGRFIKSAVGKTVIIALVAGILIFTIRRFNNRKRR